LFLLLFFIFLFFSGVAILEWSVVATMRSYVVGLQPAECLDPKVGCLLIGMTTAQTGDTNGPVMGFKLRFEHIFRFDLNCKDSVQKIVIRFEI